MARVLRAAVPVTSPSGEYRVLVPGEDVPDWAVSQIRNPRAWAEAAVPVAAAPVAQLVQEPAAAAPIVPPPAPDPAEVVQDAPADTGEAEPLEDLQEGEDDQPAPEAPDYPGMTKAQLVTLAEQRNEAGEKIATSGTKADLIDALEAADEAAQGGE